MYWIINDNIEFRPDAKKLTSACNPEMNVTLTTPASRCLLLLLEASPEIVLQQDFFKKVWEEEGMLVPTNTLYQNISIVRRGLRAVGETDRRLIATIPRKGFQIDGSVKIAKRSDAENITINHNNIDDIPSARSDEVNIPANLHDGELDLQENGPGVIHKRSFLKKIAFAHRYKLPIIVMLISFSIGLFINSVAKHLSGGTGLLNSYSLMEKDNGCSFYTKDDALDGSSNYQKYKSLILESGLNCKNYPWVYFPMSKTSPTLTALICKNNILTTSGPECVSLYFRGINSD
ncbi:putative transcriptional regulator [Enterobacter sp. FY-07]|uniref:winged helix-turn-helix domain-containing protein n=1 Tax=Kosakonia oryzendophytica TaxID=1005665 RepID=UPI0007777770|nr:transcriptional regulator [Kosakonia oryzendophytica]AMO48909.1 putative transcriptional regulator [Enterobacter sp. FY-07]TDT60109.1 DNA-binding winged helix-turn-helix (wHTH) protein [Enterobacter sp. AG5470]WBT56588.1 transcriptional regulator [Kosakonia oryzendophytica]